QNGRYGQNSTTWRMNRGNAENPGMDKTRPKLLWIWPKPLPRTGWPSFGHIEASFGRVLSMLLRRVFMQVKVILIEFWPYWSYWPCFRWRTPERSQRSPLPLGLTGRAPANPGYRWFSGRTMRCLLPQVMLTALQTERGCYQSATASRQSNCHRHGCG